MPSSSRRRREGPTDQSRRWGGREANQVGGERGCTMEILEHHHEVGVVWLGIGEPWQASEQWRGLTNLGEDWPCGGVRKLPQPTHILGFLAPPLSSLPTFAPDLPVFSPSPFPPHCLYPCYFLCSSVLRVTVSYILSGFSVFFRWQDKSSSCCLKVSITRI